MTLSETGKIDPYKRHQKGLSMADLHPSIKGYCACGCGVALTGRKRRWADQSHADKLLTEFQIIKGDTGVIRNVLFEIDQGHCKKCGEFDLDWEADHIIPVHKGGGGCTLENFQTLCIKCHKEKTKIQAKK